MLWRILIGLFLIAHGLIHLMFLLKVTNDPKWPFNLNKSWLLPNVNTETLRVLGTALVFISTIAFVLIGIAIIFGLLSAKILAPAIVSAAVISLGLTTIFWAKDFWIVTLLNSAIIGIVLFSNLLPGLLEK